MPLRHRNQFTDHRLYFVTTSTYRHIPFPRQPNSLILIENVVFKTCCDKEIKLFAYVIMPNHMHFIMSSELGSPGISIYIHSLKGRIREDLQGKGKLWQDRFDDLGLYSMKQFLIKLNYIHYNPVRAGLVENPENWRYSCFRDWLNLDGSRGIHFLFDDE
jgi:putative transposase